MSFAKAMQPTPRASQVTVASSVYSTDGNQAWNEEAPPVPQVPRVYLQSTPQASKATFASSVYSRNIDDDVLRAVPPVAQVDAPSYAEGVYTAHDAEASTCLNSATDHEVEPGFQYRASRQKGFNKALAMLEGRSTSPWVSTTSVLEPTNEEPQAQSRRSKRFDKWVKRQAEMQSERARQQEHEMAVFGADADYIAGGGEQQALLHSTIPSNRYSNMPEDSKQVSLPAPIPSHTQASVKKLKPVSPEERAKNPEKYYPYVCEPAKVIAAERTVKAFVKQTKDALVGPPKPTPYDKLMASMTPEMKLAFTCNGMFPSPEELFKRDEKTTEISAPKLQGQMPAPQTKQMKKKEAMLVAKSSQDETKEGTARTEADLKSERKAKVKKEREAAKQRAPITNREAKRIMPHTVNGSRLVSGDRRRPLAPLIPIEEAQAKYVDHPNRNHPHFPPVKQIPANRETVWGDFCEIDRVRFEKLFPAGENAGAPALRREGAEEADPRLSNNLLAAAYLEEIASPSPANFEEIRNGKFPTERRVLYDPELSSDVALPRFNDKQLPLEPNPHGAPEDFGHRLSKALREERLKGYRSRNASKQDVSALSAPPDGFADRRQRWTREMKGYEESCDM